MHIRCQGVPVSRADPSAGPVRLLLLLPRRHHLLAADLSSAHSTVLRDSNQRLLLSEIRMPCAHERKEREYDYDDNHNNHNSSAEVRSADTRNLHGSQRLRHQRQLLPGGTGGEEGERTVPRVHLRRQRHDQVQPQGVPAAGAPLAQDEPVLLQDAIGALLGHPSYTPLPFIAPRRKHDCNTDSERREKTRDYKTDQEDTGCVKAAPARTRRPPPAGVGRNGTAVRPSSAATH